MKSWTKITALILGICLLLCMGGCSSDSGEVTTVPTETTVPPTTLPDPYDLYETACGALENQSNLVISYTRQENRTVGSESYASTSEGTASYTGLGTEEMQALVTEDLTFGGYEAQYIQSYLSGSGYSRVSNCNFTCSMSAEEFLSQQLPAVLLDISLYADVTVTPGSDSTVISFHNAAALESWVCDLAEAELVTAHGSATLDASGALVETSYHAEYTVSTATYTVDVTAAVSTPAALDFSSEQPVYPENCTLVSDLSIPRRLIQVVGDVYATNCMTVSYSDSLYSEAFAVIRSQSGNFNTYGTGNDFLCAMDTQVSVTDYTGTATTNSQSISYLDGVYSYVTNGGEPTTAADVTGEQVRTACEDAILGSLFELDCIAGATMTDIGDFLYIEFTGSDSYAEDMCDSIYPILGMDLDSYSESYTTDAAGGYLVINKYTGLPTSLGMSVSRSHVISGVPYALTYQLDQAMELPGASAYENITGKTEPETETTAGATPLFYKVTGADGQTMWLLGTIHTGDQRTGNLPDAITDAFTASDALAVEYDSIAFEEKLATDAALQSQLVEAYYYGDGSDAASHLSSESAAKLKQLIQATGSSNASAPYMKVSILSSVIENFYLQQGSNLVSSKGMDNRLLRLAKEQEKTVYDIESGIGQLQMLANFSDGLQAHLLEETLELGLLGYCDEVSQLYELWCQGDEAALQAYLAVDTASLSEAEQEYYKVMTTDRNAVMAAAAAGYLESGETVFYAVGLAHLMGEDGIVEALRAQGYTVELVTYE